MLQGKYSYLFQEFIPKPPLCVHSKNNLAAYSNKNSLKRNPSNSLPKSHIKFKLIHLHPPPHLLIQKPNQKMSTTQPQTQQQPVVVYPNTVPGQATATPSHSHSDGSFGTVFIVLAIIIVISAIACFLGRLCNKRMSRSSSQSSKPSKKKQTQTHDFCPKAEDIEFGFDGRAPAAKPTDPGYPSKGFIKMPGNGDPRGFRKPEHRDNPAGFRMPGNGIPTAFRMPGNGDNKGEAKPHVDDGSLKAGA